MTTTNDVSSRHGHRTLVTASGEHYEDDGTPFDWEHPRPCKSCGAQIEPGKNDPCIAGLPGTWSACCGHGLDRVPDSEWLAGFVQLLDGRSIRFSGTFGGQRIRQAVAAALNNEPLPEGFVFDNG